MPASAHQALCSRAQHTRRVAHTPRAGLLKARCSPKGRAPPPAARRVAADAASVPLPDAASVPLPDSSGGSGGGDGGGVKRTGGDGRPEDDDADDELLGADEAASLASAAGSELPRDFLALASAEGIKRSSVTRWLALKKGLFTGLLANVPWFRDRLIYDHRFLFKVGAEIAIDSGCATFAEVRKRGDEFWDEFEFYLSDLLVGLVMDVVLVGLMAPTAVLGRSRRGAKGGIQKLFEKAPAAFFEKNIPGVREFGLPARFGCLGVKFFEYGIGGLVCGLVGQSIANAAMLARRAHSPDADFAVDPPPILRTAMVWGLFMGVSSNLRYQAVFGLERLVDASIAKRVPQIAYGTTVLIRFANNIVGGENFIDMARYFGVQ